MTLYGTRTIDGSEQDYRFIVDTIELEKIWNANSGGKLKPLFAHFVGRPSPF